MSGSFCGTRSQFRFPYDRKAIVDLCNLNVDRSWRTAETSIRIYNNVIFYCKTEAAPVRSFSCIIMNVFAISLHIVESHSSKIALQTCGNQDLKISLAISTVIEGWQFGSLHKCNEMK